MKNYRNLALFLLIGIAICIFGMYGIYQYKISAVSKEDSEVEFIVEKGMNYSTVADALEKEGLIKSAVFFKFYVKINETPDLKHGKYSLKKNMNVKQIIDVLGQASSYNPDVVSITIPEGKHLEDFAEIAAKVTNNTKESLLTLWNSEEFIDEVIEKYWFVTKDIKKSGIRYSLEGYFFPSTYELKNKDVDGEYIAYRILDQMDKILTKYKKEITDSDYSVHEILTMASIVEHEAILDKDRPVIAGVFYKRLSIGMKLQSCATVGYAINEWKLSYSQKDLDTDSPYNTYFYTGLPIGPGNNPGEKSIVAAINPTKTDYKYFLADVCSKNPETYFSKTYEEHDAKAKKYLTCTKK